MARLPDTTGPLSPEAQKALGEIVEQVLGRGASATAQVVQHVLAHESIPQPLADQVGKELGGAGRAARAVLISL